MFVLCLTKYITTVTAIKEGKKKQIEREMPVDCIKRFPFFRKREKEREREVRSELIFIFEFAISSTIIRYHEYNSTKFAAFFFFCQC
jgi:hypothetical protein